MGEFATREVRMAIQQELPQGPPRPSEADTDDVYDEEPRRRPWGAVTSVVLALALVFVGYQWHQASGREQALGAQIGALRAEAEAQRLRAEEVRAQSDGLQKRLAALGVEKESLAERLTAMERAAESRAAATREARRSKSKVVAREAPRAPRTSATPVAATTGKPTAKPAAKKIR
jgi:hypothetical protein